MNSNGKLSIVTLAALAVVLGSKGDNVLCFSVVAYQGKAVLFGPSLRRQ
jgi:hypothetical protein